MFLYSVYESLLACDKPDLDLYCAKFDRFKEVINETHPKLANKTVVFCRENLAELSTLNWDVPYHHSYSLNLSPLVFTYFDPYIISLIIKL